MESEIRDMLRAKAGDAVGFSPTLPVSTMGRAKRRRVGTALTTLAAIAGVVAASITGINAITRSNQGFVGREPQLELTHTVDLQGSPGDVVVGHDAIWATRFGAKPGADSVLQLDPKDGRILATVTPGETDERLAGGFSGLAAGEGAVWLAAMPVGEASGSISTFSCTATAIGSGPSPEPQCSTTFKAEGQPLPPASFSMQASPQPGRIGSPTPPTTLTPRRPEPDQEWRMVRIDPKSTQTRVGPAVRGWQPNTVAAGEGAVWVGGGFTDTGAIYRLDPKTMRLTKTIDFGGFPAEIVIIEGSIWVAVTGIGPDAGHVLRIDPKTNGVLARIPIPGNGPLDLAAGEEGLWTVAFRKEFRGPVDVFEIDPDTNLTSDPIAAEIGGSRLVVGEGLVWLSRGDTPGIVWIDPSSDTVGAGFAYASPSGQPGPFVVGGGAVWAAGVPSEGALSRFSIGY